MNGTDDGRFSLTACRCIGACGLAPVLTVNEDVYGRLTVDDVDGILAKYCRIICGSYPSTSWTLLRTPCPPAQRWWRSP